MSKLVSGFSKFNKEQKVDWLTNNFVDTEDEDEDSGESEAEKKSSKKKAKKNLEI